MVYRLFQKMKTAKYYDLHFIAHHTTLRSIDTCILYYYIRYTVTWTSVLYVEQTAIIPITSAVFRKSLTTLDLYIIVVITYHAVVINSLFN